MTASASSQRDTATLSTAQAIAVEIAARGCTHVFTLMGDGNMHLLAALAGQGVDVVEVRHESAAVAMAEGYGLARGDVGFCSVTHGPGFTHTATSLVVATRNRSPLVLIVAETPDGYEGAQRFDQRSFAQACGVPYRRLSPEEDPAAVIETVVALAVARACPVVLGVAADLFLAAIPDTPSVPAALDGVPAGPTAADDAEAIAQLLAALEGASRPVLIAGRGALDGDVPDVMASLADHYGAALATTIPAKGLFDLHPNNLGISGGLSHPAAEALLRQADVVVSVGASLDRGTTSSMRLYRDATVLQLTNDPAPDPSPYANVQQLRGDAAVVISGLLRALPAGSARAPWFGSVASPAECWQADLRQFAPAIAPGTVDPRRAVMTVDARIPDDAIVVIGNGHCSGFASTFVQAPPAGFFWAAHGFGSIGQALTTAIGMACAAPNRKVVVFEGDAAFMMHVQEVETAARVGADLSVFVLNDGALGTEYQRLFYVEDPEVAELAAVATPDLAALGRALGAHGATIDDEQTMDQVTEDALRPGLAVVDVKTDRAVLSRHMRWLERANDAPPRAGEPDETEPIRD